MPGSVTFLAMPSLWQTIPDSRVHFHILSLCNIYFVHVFLSRFYIFCFDPICVNFVLCMLICFLASICHCIYCISLCLLESVQPRPCYVFTCFIVLVFLIVFVFSCVQRFLVWRCSNKSNVQFCALPMKIAEMFFVHLLRKWHRWLSSARLVRKFLYLALH